MGKYFSIGELCRSKVAKDENIDNTPNEKELGYLENLIKTLDIIRESFGAPIKVNSGFRNQKLNNRVKGSKTSYHLFGMAADITSSDNKKLFELIIKLKDEGIIKFSELVNEYPNSQGVPSWIHIGINPQNLKNQIKTIK